VVDAPTVAQLTTTSGTAIQWYAASTGGSALLSTASLTTATTYYASQTTGGCESSTRLAVAVTLSNPSAPTGDGAQNFCIVDTPNPTVADLVATGTGVQWYSDALATSLLASTDALADGVTYYATQTISGCEGMSTFDVVVTISNTSKPGGNPIQSFCIIDNATPTVADLTATGTTIEWYSESGAINLLADSEVLVNGTNYYALDAGNTSGCAGETLEVTVEISDTTAPTGTAPQSFCIIDTPTVADLVASGNNIKWYDNLGALLAAGYALTDGAVYSATQESVLTGCESSTTLDVTVVIADTTSPTGSTPHRFCINDNSTVSDLTASGNNIKWYDNLGALLAAGYALTDGAVYSATQESVLTGCESSTTLEVSVEISDTTAPTGTAPQSFCIIDTPTVSDLVASGNNIKWYDNLGALLASGDALADGAVYSATQESVLTGCESSTTLDVTVVITDTTSPTGSAPQRFCINDNATVSDLVASGNNIKWYDNLGALLAAGDALTDGAVYSATQESVLTGCESSTTLDVTVVIADTTSPTGSTPHRFCINDNATVSDLTASGNNIKWYDNLGALLASGDALTDGAVYSATQESVLTGCESSTTLDVTVVISDPVAPTTVDASPVFCLDTNPLVSDISITGNGVQWYSDLATTTLVNSTDVLIDGNTYYATQTDIIDGCESSSSLAVVINLSNPILDTTNSVMNQATCNSNDGSITGVTVSSGQANYTWQWSNSTGVVGNNQDITNIPAGSYTVVVTDAIGCQDSVQRVIVENSGAAIIDVSSATLNHETCSDANGSITNLNVSGGNGNLSYEWSDGTSVISTDLILQPVNEGNYTLTVTDALGCTSIAGPFGIIDLAGPTLDLNSIVIQNTGCNEANGSISGIQVVGGNGNLLYDWSNGASSVGTTLDLSNLLAGDYVLIVTDEENCTVTLDTSLTSNQASTVLATDDTSSTQSGITVEIDIYANDIGKQTSIIIVDGPTNGTASVNLSGIMTYTPNSGFSGVDSVLYSICDDFCNTICEEAYVYITVIKKNPIRIPNGFSPNSDGFNDTYVIEGLDEYPDNEIIIFNRWGDRVFSANPYLNDWDGTATNKQLKITGEQVTEGTYYYILDLHVEGIDLFNGFIELRTD